MVAWGRWVIICGTGVFDLTAWDDFIEIATLETV